MVEQGSHFNKSGTLTSLHENGLSLAVSDILFDFDESKCNFFHYFILIYLKTDWF